MADKTIIVPTPQKINVVSNPTGNTGATLAGALGWDTSLHSDAYAISDWFVGYNSAVTSPATGYHAKWVKEGIDGGEDICLKMMDLNGQFGLEHRWVGSSINLGTPASLGLSVGDKITISYFQKVDTTGVKSATAGIHRYSLSNSYHNFWDGTFNIYNTIDSNWERKSFTLTITSDWSLALYMSLYFRGHYGDEGTVWVDNFYVGKNNLPSILTLIDSSPTLSIGTTLYTLTETTQTNAIKPSVSTNIILYLPTETTQTNAIKPNVSIGKILHLPTETTQTNAITPNITIGITLMILISSSSSVGIPLSVVNIFSLSPIILKAEIPVKTKQDFKVIKGDSLKIVFKIVGVEDLNAMNGVEWNFKKKNSIKNTINKNLNDGITILSANKFQVKLNSSDTEHLKGIGTHKAKITDETGNKSTVSIGSVSIIEN